MLKIRALTAAVLLALAISALFLLPRNGWSALCALVLGIAAWEWAGLAALAGRGRIVYALGVVALLALAVASGGPRGSGFYAPALLYCAAALFWIVMVPLWIWRRPRFGSRAVLLGAGVVALVPAFAALIELRSIEPPALLLAILVTVWISDSAAYLVGRRFGRHKLAPAISPGKSWEGVAAGLIAVGLYALAWIGFGRIAGLPTTLGSAPAGAAWMPLLLLGLAIAGMIGDLFESLIKRHAGVKDSGTLLPGHGGVLDRIDALAPVLPLAALAFIR